MVQRQNSPKLIARDIRSHLDELIRERQNPFFYGRSHDIERLEQVLTPVDGSFPPHAIFVTGLPGVGRRSLIRYKAPTLLSLRKFTEIRVGDGDSIHDICVNVADNVEPYSTKEGLGRIVQQISGLSESKALERTLNNLRTMVQTGELPIFLDEGGLLDSDGYISPPIQALLQALAPNDSAYLFFVSSRRPHGGSEISIPIVPLESLAPEDTKRLITALANHDDLSISTSDVAELAQYVAGYPPAANFAIHQAKYYGVELVMRDKRRLVQFRTNIFLRHLAKANLSSIEQGCLRLLATFSPLPLAVIAGVLAVDLPTLTNVTMRLIDFAFVVTTKDGYYRIADPVADAATNAFGFPPNRELKILARSLSTYLEQSTGERPLLDLSRVLFRVARWIDDHVAASTAIHLANDLIKLTEALYHAREYEKVVEIGYVALQERPNSVSARSFLIRALVQEELWTEAEEQIRELRKYAPPRDVYFLMGFLERKRGKIDEAIRAFEESERLGRYGAAISRELALCYSLHGNQERASIYIEEAIQREGGNRFLIDLWVQIEIRRRNEEAARQALNRLEAIDMPVYYYHRLSAFELAFERLPEALDAARRAYTECIDDIPPFGVLVQLTHCEIQSGNLDQAQKVLGEIEQRYGRVHRDIRLALQCELENAHGRYSNALALAGQIANKNAPYYKKIRHDALAGEVRVSALRDQVRQKYEDELSNLDRELANMRVDQFVPGELRLD